MILRDAYSAKAVAIAHTQSGSNKVAYLGRGLFPAKKKMGLDLKTIKTSTGLPVSLAPSNFDAKSTIRSRSGFKIDQTEMAFFRESMLVSEQDEQDVMRAVDSADPYAKEVLERVYNDAETLVNGAAVVPERMIMQLLSPSDGSPKISIAADGATYAYNYDPNGTYAANNYLAISTTTDKWDDHESSDPMKDIQTACDAVEANTGVRPTGMIVSRATLNHLKQNANVKSALLAQNATANVFMTDAKIKELFLTELGVAVILYTKQYKDESGTATKFYPDGYATLIPDGALGNTWYGTTPEERTLLGANEADVAIVDTGVTVAVTTTTDPVNTKTTVSEIVLPSYERMDETYVIKAY